METDGRKPGKKRVKAHSRRTKDGKKTRVKGYTACTKTSCSKSGYKVKGNKHGYDGGFGDELKEKLSLKK